MIVRRASPVDLPHIVALYLADPITGKREISGETLPPVYAEAFARIDADPAQRLLVVEADGVVVGTAQMTLIQHVMAQGLRRAVLEAVFVHPRYQGCGVGKVLFQTVIDIAREWNCRNVELTSNKQRGAAHAFYEKLGFVATHEGFKLVI